MGPLRQRGGPFTMPRGPQGKGTGEQGIGSRRCATGKILASRPKNFFLPLRETGKKNFSAEWPTASLDPENSPWAERVTELASELCYAHSLSWDAKGGEPMAGEKKSGNKDKAIQTIVFITATIQLVRALIDLIGKLLE